MTNTIYHSFYNPDYQFVEASHEYFYRGSRKVKYSVTQFISRYFEPFDEIAQAERYADKHNLKVQEVLLEWHRKANIASIAGTAIHSFMENIKRGKLIEPDFRNAHKMDLLQEVVERYEILLPQAKAFHEDTKLKLIPYEMEYTVGIEDFIAGNIDLLCYNQYAEEFQIWDYKNLKEFTTDNHFNQFVKAPFERLKDCSLSHYSLQLNMYKAMLQRTFDIPIGKCYCVHFNYANPENGFKVYECYNLQKECNDELDKLVRGDIE